MGRVLSYAITKEKSNFTRKELEAFLRISDKYNAGWYEKIWSCENFYVDPVDFYPNWNTYGGTVDTWEEVNIRYEEIKKTGKHHIDIVRQLKEENLVRYHSTKDMLRVVSCFTKVQGNELNSLLVLTALLEISRECPKCKIRLRDEGEFLYWNLFIQNGRVLPDLRELKSELQRWLAISFMGADSNDLTMLKSNPHFKSMSDRVRDELGLNACYYNTSKKYLPWLIEKIAIIFNKISNEKTFSDYLCIHNVMILDPEDWFPPENWFRPVDISKFKDYEMSPGTIMDGFAGEGFGLADPADKKSAEMMGGILDMLTNSGVMEKGTSIDIIGTGSFEYTGTKKEE